MGYGSTERIFRNHRLPNCASVFLRLGQEWPGMPCLCRCFKALLDVGKVRVPPHVLDFEVRGGLLGTSFPKPVHDCGIDF